jgi:hypothetical protein
MWSFPAAFCGFNRFHQSTPGGKRFLQIASRGEIAASLNF